MSSWEREGQWQPRDVCTSPGSPSKPGKNSQKRRFKMVKSLICTRNGRKFQKYPPLVYPDPVGIIFLDPYPFQPIYGKAKLYVLFPRKFQYTVQHIEIMTPQLWRWGERLSHPFLRQMTIPMKISKMFTLQSMKNHNGEKIKFYNLEKTDCKPLRREWQVACNPLPGILHWRRIISTKFVKHTFRRTSANWEKKSDQ